jgi:hypothetical protein
MAHFKCVPCMARLHAGNPADLIDECCPECGSLLEPVGELSEVVGFRMVQPERWDDEGGLRDDGLALAEAVALAASVVPPGAGNDLVVVPPATTDWRPL